MEANFWQSRWSEGRIGFHEGRPNALLVQHAAQLGAARRVLVPLCGKAEDLAWLAGQGHQVVGVELVESAARAFFTEHGAEPSVERRGHFTAFTAGAITVLAGDFFAATPEVLGPIDALYDRAAVIALPTEMRADYVEHVRALLPHTAPGLIVTVEYPQALMSGPPFSVEETELRALCQGLPLELLAEVKGEGPRFTEINAKEKAFRVTF